MTFERRYQIQERRQTAEESREERKMRKHEWVDVTVHTNLHTNPTHTLSTLHVLERTNVLHDWKRIPQVPNSTMCLYVEAILSCFRLGFDRANFFSFLSIALSTF